jgi:hypothetical protein
MKRARSSMLMTELRVARTECKVEGSGEVEKYAETEDRRLLVWDSMRSARMDGEGGRGIAFEKERVVRGVRLERGRDSESDLWISLESGEDHASR